MAVSRKKKIIITLGAVLVSAAVIVASVFATRSDLVEVQTAKVEKRAILESKVTANGEVRPIQFINLTAEVAGRVTDVYVKEGDPVKKGAPLLRVDPTQWASSASIQEAALRASQADVQNQVAVMSSSEIAVNTQRAALNTAEADLERAIVERNNAQIELKRNADLLEAQITSRSAYDTAKMRYDSMVASVNAAQARVEQSRIQVRDAEVRIGQSRAGLEAAKARVAQQQAGLARESDLLKKTTQYASIDGTVVGPIVQVGTYALSNFSSTPLLIIADMSVINVEVRVDETDIASVALGQKAKIKVDALSDKEIEGEVVEKAASAVTRTGQTIAQTTVAGSQEAKDFRVVVRVTTTNPEIRERLRPGMSATAVIATDRRENVVAIPLQALVERDPEQLKGPGAAAPATPAPNPNQNPKDKKAIKGVFLVAGDKTVFTPVETGITGENDIEIKSGLNGGQELVTGPYRQLRTLKNDQKIKREDKTKKAASGDNKEAK
ncbi:MAG TPA: efflux RND transporter periplasmic adaptor subunit [Blastocatellia bacterium]|nr:efflux RND transporter periplasmic adaptor subunit [Blastocatellia bacterium]